MRDAGADWQLVAYDGAVHSFTDWKATGLNIPGAAYNEKADRRSWTAMQSFFREIFGRRSRKRLAGLNHWTATAGCSTAVRIVAMLSAQEILVNVRQSPAHALPSFDAERK